MKLDEIVTHLDGLLRKQEIKDLGNALNGLQIQNDGRVTRVAAAVDACEAVLQQAIETGADLLIVHHGLFWSGLTPLTGVQHRKLKLALDHNLAVYSMHLPLDAHPKLGNNALLCRALGFKKLKPFFEEFGTELGWQVETRISRDELAARLAKAVGGPVHLAPGGPAIARKIGVVTGGAGSEIFKVAKLGVDTFITGEGPHWSYTAAEELGLNLFYGGHYATETFGVKALGAELKRKFRLPWEFLDHPTGL